jgi:crossover junction endodeoxyribonuclease RuvC
MDLGQPATADGPILGIDPGSLHTGYGLVDNRGGGLAMVSSGTVSPKAEWPMAQRLAYIHREIVGLVAAYRPRAMALEDVFTAKNPRGTVKLAQARAASILAAALADIPVFEYSPALVKNTVGGSGRAEKSQVAFMVASILGLSEPLGADASDALAVALCHAGQDSQTGNRHGLAAASRNRAGSWRRLSAKDLAALGYKIEGGQ